MATNNTSATQKADLIASMTPFATSVSFWRLRSNFMTRAARITDVPLITERAMEMSELCDALRALLAHEATPGVPKGAVWVAETVTVFDLLLASRAHPAALVLSGPVGAGRVRAIVELIGVPTVCEAAGIYNWASDGDVALVDGDHGLVRVNPSRRERDEARVERSEPAEG